jgi:hypothetical protein
MKNKETQKLVGSKIIKIEGNKVYLDNGSEFKVSRNELKIVQYMIQNQK